MCIQQTVQHLTAKRGARSVPLELQETSTEIKAKKQKKRLPKRNNSSIGC